MGEFDAYIICISIVPYLLGMLLLTIPLAWLLKNKGNKLSHAEMFYAAMHLLLITWMIIDILRIINVNALLGNILMMLAFFAIMLLMIVTYLFSITLKRELLTIDVILTFPVFLITMYFVFNLPWFITKESGILVFYFSQTHFFYWLAGILMAGLLTIKTLSVPLEWFKQKNIKLRILNLETMIILALLIGIIFQVIIYPKFIKIPLTSFIVSIIFYASYRVDRKIKNKIKNEKFKTKKESSPKEDAFRRIVDFL